MSDELSKRNEGLLQGSYDCVDRVLLNGYYGLCHSAGGFRLWWSRLKGGDGPLDRNLLMRMAGHFSRRLRAYAAAHGIPVVKCAAGQEKHKLAEEYLEKTSLRTGVFLILVGRALAPELRTKQQFASHRYLRRPEYRNGNPPLARPDLEF
jgi:hypothetical protein